MDVKKLRVKLFADMETMTKEDMIQELVEAGYKIRYDLSGHGILNDDGSLFKSDSLTQSNSVYAANESNDQNAFYSTIGDFYAYDEYMCETFISPSDMVYPMDDLWEVKDVNNKWTSRSVDLRIA